MPTIRKQLDPLKARKPGRPNKLQIFTTADGYATRIACLLEHAGGHRYRRTEEAWSKWACEGCGDVQDAMELADRQVVARTRERGAALRRNKVNLYLATTQIGDQVFSVTFFAQDLRAVRDILVQHTEQWIELGKNELDLTSNDPKWPRRAVDAGFRREPDVYCQTITGNRSVNWAVRTESSGADDVRAMWRSLGDITGVVDRVLLDLNNMRQLILTLEDQAGELTVKLKALRKDLKARHESARFVVQEAEREGT